MLLPSDVARLVLGYLQEEGLSATSQAFIHESPNLKEYAEHTTADGTIPACVFSVFGKGLTTILNEYVAAKAKESCHEVPAMMTSLWKKLDFTLNQIKSLQNSPAISASQRTRSRIGVANMARQRALTMASAGAVICSSVSETSSIISPAHTCHSMLGHSTPVSYTGSHPRPASAIGTHQQINDGGRLLSTPRDSPVQIIVSEHRLNPGPMSPGRRKWDTPRKRGGGLSGSSGSGRAATTVSSLSVEPQTEEVVDENFPQLVIQNARDKILGDRSLQEKLAENINKILANEPTPQTSKASSNTVEADQSIDEILGLQGEIHMSDDAIHDILEQTESDPAFQALFDLFDYNRTRSTDGEPGEADISSSLEETDGAVPSSAVKPLQSDDPGATHRDTSASDATSMTLRKTTGQERKTRKNTAPSLLKKTVLGSSGRASRIENSSARLLVSHGEHRSVSAATTDPNRKETAPLFTDSAGVTPMDIDEPLITPPPPLDSLGSQEPATKDSTSTAATLGQSTTVPAAFAVPEETSVSHVDKRQEQKRAEGSKEQPAAAPSSALSNTTAFLSPVQVQLNNSSGLPANLPPTSVLNSGGDTLPVSSLSTRSLSTTSASAGATATAASSSVSAAASVIAMPGLPTSVSSPATPKSASSTSAADSSNVVSLKIIISDNQDENSSSDAALNQAISSISSDKIPTIYLSSPAKSPAAVPGTPKVNFDEVAQAVSGLQNSEVHASPLGSKAGAVIASPLTGTSQAQQSYIIQLPLDSATPALQGTTASYFLVTDTQTTDAQTRQVLLPTGVSKGQPLSTNQFGVNTPNCSQGYATGSALILPSPVKPMMLPVSAVGQNTLAKVPMVSNQLVAVPNPAPVQQTVALKTKPSSVPTRQSAAAGTEKNLVSKQVQLVSTDNAGQQDASKGTSHRRILCFEPPAETQPQTAKTIKTATPMVPNTSTSQSAQQTEKSKHPVTRTKPNILTGNKPKRRVETIRCSADPQAGVSLAKQSVSLQQPQKDPVNKNFRKQDHNIHNKESKSASASSVDASQPRSVKTSESRGRTKSNDRKHQHDKSSDEGKTKEAQSSRSLSCDSALKSGGRKDKEESSRKEPAEKAPVRPREGRPEKRTPSQEVPNVTANKENEMKGSTQEQPQHSAPSSSASRDFSPPAAAPSTPNTQPKASKATSKTSSLAKQAAEMLQDIQGLNSPSTPVKRPGSTDLSVPGTGNNQEASADCPKTPSRQKKGKDGEATPKRLLPPNTPDVPTCSPASEAGSENSINMAAHTLMILSRAAIARTGTPLKDSLRQEGVGEKSPTSSKSSKKRKQTSPTASPPAKKESKRSPSKKKDREKKKVVDCFPHDLDVDKFLSSLHYDE